MIRRPRPTGPPESSSVGSSCRRSGRPVDATGGAGYVTASARPTGNLGRPLTCSSTTPATGPPCRSVEAHESLPSVEPGRPGPPGQAGPGSGRQDPELRGVQPAGRSIGRRLEGPGSPHRGPGGHPPAQRAAVSGDPVCPLSAGGSSRPPQLQAPPRARLATSWSRASPPP